MCICVYSYVHIMCVCVCVCLCVCVYITRNIIRLTRDLSNYPALYDVGHLWVDSLALCIIVESLIAFTFSVIAMHVHTNSSIRRRFLFLPFFPSHARILIHISLIIV